MYWLRWLAAVLEVPLEELERATATARRRRGPAAAAPPVTPAWTDGPDPLAARVHALRTADDLVGGADLADLVDGALATAPRAEPGLLAELAQLATWVSADAGRPAAAAHACRLGVRWAAAAGDDALAGHVLATLAHVTAEPAHALRLARQGYARARPWASAGTRSLLLHRVAYAAARAGDRYHCERALSAAERLYDRRDPAHDPAWLYWFDGTELVAMTGRCHAVLGRARTAEPLLRQALAGPLRPRPWALYASWLAVALVDLGDVEQACAVAWPALLAAVRVGSVRASDQVLALGPRLRRYRRLPAVRRYGERVRAAAPYLPTGAGPPALAGCG